MYSEFRDVISDNDTKWRFRSYWGRLRWESIEVRQEVSGDEGMGRDRVIEPTRFRTGGGTGGGVGRGRELRGEGRGRDVNEQKTRWNP